MNDDDCPICGQHGQIYYEGFTDPEWEDKHYTERDSTVGQRFCSIKHLVVWLEQQGFEIPDQEEREEMKNTDKELGKWKEVDEMGTEKIVRVVEKSGADEIVIHNHYPEEGIDTKTTVKDTESLGRAIREL